MPCSLFKNMLVLTVCLVVVLFASGGKLAAAGKAEQQPEVPLEWTDSDTGHRVVRISRAAPGNTSFYFHNNPFVPGQGAAGDLMVYYHRTGKGKDSLKQLRVLNLKTLATRQLTPSMHKISGEIVSPLRREAFYQSENVVYGVNIDTSKIREVGTLPEELHGSVRTINANGTLLAGAFRDKRYREIHERYPKKGEYMNRIFDAKLPSKLFTLNVETGEIVIVYQENAWLNHLQFSPTDPQRLMYCHEGPWHKLHRLWNIDLDTKEISKIHERTVE
jgi:oligogalacturonide lyase